MALRIPAELESHRSRLFDPPFLITNTGEYEPLQLAYVSPRPIHVVSMYGNVVWDESRTKCDTDGLTNGNACEVADE